MMRQLLGGLVSVLLVASGGCGLEAPEETEAQDRSSAGSERLACNEATCPNGCCTESGTCMAGLSADACGVAAHACRACGAGEGCMDVRTQAWFSLPGIHRTCAKLPAALDCADGCTETDGSCILGTSLGACGVGGEACQRCSSGQACQSYWLSNGFVERSCRAPSGQRWLVSVLDLSIEELDAEGNPQFSAPPDPYVEISVAASGVTNRTQTVLDSFNPTFNAPVLIDHESSLLSWAVSIEVWDDESGPRDQLINRLYFAPSKQDLERGWMKVRFLMTTVTLQFTRQ